LAKQYKALNCIQDATFQNLFPTKSKENKYHKYIIYNKYIINKYKFFFLLSLKFSCMYKILIMQFNSTSKIKEIFKKTFTKKHILIIANRNFCPLIYICIYYIYYIFIYIGIHIYIYIHVKK